MLTFKSEIKQHNGTSQEVEYRKTDFYGPFLKMRLMKYNGGIFEVTPLELKTETAEVSMSDFALLSQVAKELYKKIGKFTLRIKYFNVTINSEKTEELLLQELVKIPLF